MKHIYLLSAAFFTVALTACTKTDLSVEDYVKKHAFETNLKLGEQFGPDAKSLIEAKAQGKELLYIFTMREDIGQTAEDLARFQRDNKEQIMRKNCKELTNNNYFAKGMTYRFQFKTDQNKRALDELIVSTQTCQDWMK